jgi:fused signal recognition particle receptor
MFGSLKEKLKKWVAKNSEEESEEKPKEKTAKKDKKETKKKETKKITKESPKNEKVEEIKEEIEKEVKEKKKSSFFKKKLTEEKFEELFEELELILLQNNCAYEAVESIKESLKEKLVGENLSDVDLGHELRVSIESILINPENFLETIKSSESKPFVILFTGINGSGKTTTIAKIANYLKENKIKSCLAAADTFRAAAIQQLEIHANNLDIPIIKKDYGSDPASVGFDAIQYAKKEKLDVVLIDTAGRIQNKDSLMKEIEKIARVTNPDMKIFLGESITGNDATEQAKAFNEAVGLTGIILSKTDVDEKGGTAISVSHITKKPILFLGTGQEYKDVEIFDKKNIIKKLDL